MFLKIKISNKMFKVWVFHPKLEIEAFWNYFY